MFDPDPYFEFRNLVTVANPRPAVAGGPSVEVALEAEASVPAPPLGSRTRRLLRASGGNVTTSPRGPNGAA